MLRTNAAGSRSTSWRILVTICWRTLPSTPRNAVSTSLAPPPCGTNAPDFASAMNRTSDAADINRNSLTRKGRLLPADPGDAKNVGGTRGAEGHAGGDHQPVHRLAETL